MKNKDKEIIKDNLRAYLNNFKSITIETADYGGGYYVFEEGREGYIQYCNNIHYLNGWLYGAVQSRCKVMTVKEK